MAKEVPEVAVEVGGAQGKSAKSEGSALNAESSTTPLHTREELERMTVKERVKRRIANLADAPAEVSLLGPSYGGYTNWASPPPAGNQVGRTAVDDLVGEGLEAFEPLIEASEDSRPSRFKETNSSSGQNRQLTVGELAQIAAMRIARKEFSDPKRGTPREQMSCWWDAVQEKGLKAVLVEAVETGDKGAGAQAMLLVEKFPAEALEPIKRGFERAESNIARWNYVEALRLLPQVGVENWLRTEMTEPPKLERRVIGAQMLLRLRYNREQVIQAMITEWEKLGAEEDEQGINRLVRQLRATRSVETIDALADGLMNRPVRVKWRVVYPFYGSDDIFPYAWGRGRITKGEKEQNARIQRAFERLLVGVLEDDERVRGEEFHVSKEVKLREPRIGDVAALQLAQWHPQKYRFTVTGSVRERDTERHAMVNVWRKEQGLPEVVPLKKPLVAPADEAVLGPLLRRAVESNNEAARGEALKAIQGMGLPALAGVELTLAGVPETHAAKAGLERVAQSLANTVREVEIFEKYGKLDASTRELIQGFKGQELTGERLADAMRHAIQMLPGKVTVAINVEGDSREAGLMVRVRVWDTARNPEKFIIAGSVMAEGKQTNPQNIEVSLVLAGKLETYEVIAKALDKGLQSPRSGSLFMGLSGYAPNKIVEVGEIDSW